MKYLKNYTNKQTQMQEQKDLTQANLQELLETLEAQKIQQMMETYTMQTTK